MDLDQRAPEAGAWYEGISRYQWVVLVIASLGWVFDVFEGQIFVASMNEAMPELIPPSASDASIPYYTNLTFAAFLLGGALGGVVFGRLSDRYGRVRVLVWTILMYSMATCLSAFSASWWQMAAFRFLVALGTGGEWAVATALVAEVFPRRARAWSLSIFHASSVLGSWMAAAAGVLLVANPDLGWRWGFVIGAAPALLVLWVRLSLKEPERGPSADPSKPRGSGALGRLFRGPLLRRTLVGVGLATVGLATFWGTHVYGKDRLRGMVEARALAELPEGADDSERADLLASLARPLKHWEMAGMFLVTTGGGIGLVCFGPMADRFGRRGAFLAFHLGGLVAALLLFQVISGVTPVLLFLPVFGFLTLGMHAGYAVYFPELFPTEVRGTGAGFCFNFGRFLAAPILFLSGWLQGPGGRSMRLEDSASLLALLMLVGVALLPFAPETRGQELPG
ncbi:MFS transporter [Tautonia plasticadhaerens]|uniref:Sialic acid transporter n=1 Tax=Tautonia plasticadhaerens TaxID=2527974 RepID=A0A518H4H3_9BACT|nr:MFS transporter [Tautonia plasticadhaerens]QDV35739.1 Putative sialic acid transporter [Tautonia plasticadhaerens]